MLKSYLKTAWRSLWKNKTTSIINIIGLSAGMTAAVFIFLWVQNELGFDDYNKDAKSVYRVTSNFPARGWTWEMTSLLLANAVKENVPQVEKVARVKDGNAPVFKIKDQSYYDDNCAYVDEDWFNIFHYDFIDGNAAAFKKNPYSIILTAWDAVKFFGKKNVTGMVLRIDSIDLAVSGVVKDAPVNSSFKYTSFIPLNIFLKNENIRKSDEQWGNANYITFIKIKPFAKVQAVERNIQMVYAKNSGDKEVAMTLMPLTQMHFETGLQNSVYQHGNKTSVYIFTILAFVLLLIACINYVNLTTANASLRAKEVSIRKIAGASRIQLFNQFIAEALLISFISITITFILIQLYLPYFNSLTGRHFGLNVASVAMWKVIGATLLAAFILNSIYPAFMLSSFKPLNVFRGLTVLKIKDVYFRKVLVVFQFAMSVMLICGAIVIYEQMQFIQQTNPGYNKSQVLTFHLPPTVDHNTKASTIRAVKNELLSKPGIQNVSIANQSIIDVGSYSTGSADWEGHDTSFNPKIAQLATDADFAQTMQLQMQAGRWFHQGNEADNSNVILNETAINELHIQPPYIGRRFTWKRKTGNIIGIVKDFKYKSLHDKTGPLVVFQNTDWCNLFMVRLAPNNTVQSVQNVEKVWKQFFPGTPVDFNFLDDKFNQLYKADRQTSLLIFGFAIIAVVISALGLFALAAFMAEQKAKEIGIRKVLGASVVSITQLLTKDFLRLVLIAIVIAFPLAWWAMNKWLQSFAYRVNISVWVFIIAGVLALLIALVTISFQAIKAAVANPVKSLSADR